MYRPLALCNSMLADMSKEEKVSFGRQHRFYKLCLKVCTLLLYISEHVKGFVVISPSVVAPVCQATDQLELTCNISGVLQQWQLTESGQVTQLQQVSSAGSSGVDSNTLMINSVMFTASRLSDQGRSPLVSRMIIKPVSEGLNGSEVNCVDTFASESARTTVFIIGDTPLAMPSIPPHSAQLLSDEVVVVLEWTISIPLGRYQHLLLPNVSINVIPHLEVVDVGNMSIQLSLLYNTQYNVSITQSGICGQPNQTAFIVLNYTKCYNPGPVVPADLIIEGYEDPALEGESITFSCNDGLTLFGPNSATCMENGEWEPDPREANCTVTGTVTAVTSFSTKAMNPSNVTNPITPCGDSPSKCPESDSGSTNLVALSLGTVFGVIFLAIIGVIVVIFSAIIFKKKSTHESRTRELEYADTSNRHERHVYNQLQHHNFKAEETQFSNYAEINSSSMQKQSTFNSRVFAFDNHVDYAQLNLSADQDKVSTTQLSQTIEKDNCPPVNLDSLLVQLRPQVGPKWYQFGEAAGIHKETLDKFAEQCSPEECIVELFDYWLLNYTEKPTWRDVAKILKTIGLTELGVNIESVYKTGTLPITVDMNYIPKLDTEEESELPPPLPPRESTPPLLNEEPPAPALPPKPTKIRLV